MVHRITAISAQKRDHQRVNIFLDGEFAFGLARSLALWLNEGDSLDDERIAELVKQDGFEQGYQKALKYTSRRPRTQAEVRIYLEEIGVTETERDEILERLVEIQLVDDKEFALAWVESRKEFRPRSRQGLVYELRRRGVADLIIDEVLCDLDENDLAYRLAIKQARKLHGMAWREFRTKVCARLMQQRFPYEVAVHAAKRAWEELQSEFMGITEINEEKMEREQIL